ncbi:MAG TPA: helix-turn-helix transcriptional regulator [Candidatus Eisenbacteria bacterium]|nr:helix-turn-helix transcriptional regulator [Candidatus Eisenbacteria bacterium]
MISPETINTSTGGGRRDKPPDRAGNDDVVDMGRVRSTAAAAAGVQEAAAIATTLGREIREARVRRRLTQASVARRAATSRGRLADLERGAGSRAPLELWVRVAMAVGRPLSVRLSRDIDAGGANPSDAGHLAAQELLLRLGRAHGWVGSVELATRPNDPSRSADVVLRAERRRLLILIEVMNRVADLGAAARSTDRKAADLEALAMLVGGDRGPFAIASGWVLVDTAANRRLVGSYPEFFRARFPGSSNTWAKALSTGSPPPTLSAVAWIDPRAGAVRALRLPG